MIKITKELTSNDIGITGSHQAGICVPKNPEIRSFFPDLNSEEKNPRTTIDFKDENNETWNFNFIYYNNKFFNGTRNEYRLTGMTKYIQQKNLKPGDLLEFVKINGNFEIRIISPKQSTSNRIELSNKWKIVK